MSDATPTTACPDAATLRALMDGILPEDQQAVTQAHVERCSTCEAALRQMSAGGESWVGIAAKLKSGSDDDPKLAAALDRLKADSGSDGESGESADLQRTLDFLQPTDDPKLLGKLGRHEISEVIGWGGMGVVLKAYDPSLHRVVAVKVLASHLAHHAVARKRFIREAQAAAAVCHDNVVTIHAIEAGLGEPEGVSSRTLDVNAVRGLTPSGSPMNQALPKIIMQFVAGGSLQERIDAEAPLELKEILRIALQTAAGLAAAHAQGVVHRDVKPANILLENGVQRVKLTDFGLARVMDDASLTLSGVIAGTPQYMAPEQAWGRDVDARADLFSLGAVMYAMCTGHSPFRARTTMAVLKRVCDDSPRSLRAINPDIPEWLCAIIDKLLAKKPEDRFQTATEVSELLSRWLAHVQQPNVVPAPQQPASVPGRMGRVPGQAVLDNITAKSAQAMLAMSELQRRPEELRHRLRIAGVVVLALLVIGIPIVLFLLSNLTDRSRWTPAESFNQWLAIVGVGGAFVLLVVMLSHWLLGDSATPGIGSGDPRTAPEHGQISLKQAMWPMLVTGSALAVFAILKLGETGTRDLDSFLGFCALQLAVTFAMCSAFRSAWNSPSWIPWLATFLFLPAVGSIYLWAAANHSIQYGPQLIYVLQAILPLVLWFGLVFVRPMVLLNANRRMRERLTGWQRLIAVAASLLFGAPLMFVVVYLLSNTSVHKQYDDTLQDPSKLIFTAPVDPLAPVPSNDPRRFPKPQLLSGNSSSSDAAIPPNPFVAAPIPESLKPLIGRWVVVSSEGAALGSVAHSGMMDAAGGGTYGGGPMMGGAPGGMPDEFGAASLGGSGANPASPPQWIEFASDHVILFDGRRAKLFAEFSDEAEPKQFTLRDQPNSQSSGANVWRHGILRLERDRLILCWTHHGLPTPSEFVGSNNQGTQLLVLRREWNPPPELQPPGDTPPVPPRAVIPFTADEAKRFQGAWARSANVPVETTNSLGMKLRVIPPGAFDLTGDDVLWTSTLASDKVPAISPSFSQPIYMAAHEVTVAQFRKFVEATQYETTAERLSSESGTERRTWQHPGIVQDSDQHPVVHVSWQDATAFCRWLSDTEQQQYRLPTITEWAFAARAGLATKTPLKLPHNARLRFFDTTAPVGSDNANLFGLNDLFGNVNEWANDNLGAFQQGSFGPADNPLNLYYSRTALGGGYRTSRKKEDGSEWMMPQLLGDSGHLDDVGFRVARVITREVEVLSGYWPTVEELIATATRASILQKGDLEKSTDPKSSPDDADKKPVIRRPVIILRGLFPIGSYSVTPNILDIEIERVDFEDDNRGFFGGLNIEPGKLNAWRKIDLAKHHKLLDEFDVSNDFVPALLTNPVFTMPLLARTDGPWPKELVTYPLLPGSTPKSKYEATHQLFRFIDFDVQPKHRYGYRVRLKFMPASKQENLPILVTPWSNPTNWIPFESPGPA